MALLAISVGVSHATPVSAPVAMGSLLDLTADEADLRGGAAGPSTPDFALRAIGLVSGGMSNLSSTGRVDRAPVFGSTVPMAAARGTADDNNDLATSSIAVFSLMDNYQRAATLGRIRIAPLIGTVGGTDGGGPKYGGSVFVAVASSGSFTDNASMAVRFRNSPTALAFGPGSTSTATITVAAAATLQRQQNGFVSVAAKSLQTTTPVGGDPVQTAEQTGRSKVPAEFTFAPNPATGVQNATSGASFGEWATARGTAPSVDRLRQTENVKPAADTLKVSRTGTVLPPVAAPVPTQASTQVPAWGTVLDRFQTGRLEQEQAPVAATPSVPMATASDPARPGEILAEQMRAAQIKAANAAMRGRQSLEPDRASEARDNARQAPELSVSVSKDPRTAAIQKVLANVDGGVQARTGRQIEAFLIGETAVRTPLARGSTVDAPLRDKIVVSAGALNNFLALP